MSPTRRSGRLSLQRRQQHWNWSGSVDCGYGAKQSGSIGLSVGGVDHAAQLLITAGDNPERMRTDPKFARLCGTAPILASSGKSERHRLHRGGDRQANRALHLAVVVRLRYCERTKAYYQRRTAEGLSRPEIMHCLKRYAAREVFHKLRADIHALQKSLNDL